MRSVYCKAISCIQHLHIMHSQLSRQAVTNNGVINTNYRAACLTKLNNDHHLSCSFPYIKVDGDYKMSKLQFFGELSCIGICSVNSQCQPSNLNQQ